MEQAWIRMVDEAEATDFVKSAYDGFIKQRGWVPHIMKVLFPPLSSPLARLGARLEAWLAAARSRRRH